MHWIYVNQLLETGQVKPYKSSIIDCTNTLQSVWDGLTRLGQCDVQSVLTTFTESLLPKELRTRWEDETITSKAVPPVQKLIEFLKLRSTQQQYEDKGHYSAPAAEKKSFPKKSSGYKGSASSQPSQAPTGQPSQAPAPQAKSNSQKAKPSSFTPCRYSCPLCPEAHYAYSCKTFRHKSVSQRMEFIKAQSLCSKCLKPGHTADDCRNDRVCSVCKGEHNTLIHGAPAGGSGPTEFTGQPLQWITLVAAN